MIGAAHADLVKKSLFESHKTRDFFAILQVNRALCELRFISSFDLARGPRIALFVDRWTCSPLKTK
jgi:hypothetical protein